MGIIMAFCIALLISGTLSVGNKNSTGSLVLFFFLIFMSILASYFWVMPFGPLLWGVAWLPLFSVGIICALFLMIPAPKVTKKINGARVEDFSTTETAISIFVWISLFVLVMAVIAGMFKW